VTPGLDQGALRTSLRKPPRLVFQFALFTGLGLALAGATILLFVRHFEHGRAREAAVREAQVTGLLAADELSARGVSRIAPDAARLQAAYDRALARVLAAGNTTGAALVTPAGEIAASAGEHTTPAPPTLHLALGGAVATELGTATISGAAADVLTAVVPIDVGGERAGALVVTRDYGPIAEAARAALLPVAVVLEVVLLGLWVALFPLLARATRRLRRQVDVIRHLAFHDSLTGLPNRTVFHDDVTRALATPGAHVALMLVDLDRFKDVNDTLGHRAGDTLLAQLGPRLASGVGATAAVARLGGDEFGVVSTVAGDEIGALELAERIREIVAEPIELAGLSLEMQASIGIALAPEHGTDVETLLRRADIALYASKDALWPTLYDASLDHDSPGRLALGAELRRAVGIPGQIVAHYQPQVDPATGGVLGVEALVRWQHPVRGLLMPDHFLALAEHTGLSRALTRLVLAQALADCGRLTFEGRPLDVFVNLAGADLVDTGLPDEVLEALRRHDVAAQRLHLEITESALASDRARAAGVLEELRELGIQIALDDFGTGWSSLGDLRRLPVDHVKIDRAFVIDLVGEPQNEVIVKATVELAHGLGLKAIAEGVSDDETVTRLAGFGCDGAQGFFISKALPVDELGAWLRRRERERSPDASSRGARAPLRVVSSA
jgi:diguanylate cyclase (GGDEF)-like protein